MCSTYNRNPPPHGEALHVDLSTGDGLDAALVRGRFGDDGADTLVDVVINAAAISEPAACEHDASVRDINVPHALIRAMERATERAGARANEGPPLLIHISTDHVYEGTKAAATGGASPLYCEDDETKPVNAYGRSKLEAERAVRAYTGDHVILRPSIIYGKKTTHPISRGLFLQWADGVLERQIAEPHSNDGNGGDRDSRVAFYDDEYRSPTYVKDFSAVISRMVTDYAGGGGGRFVGHTFNCGGDRAMSRAEMVIALARVRGYDASTVRTGHAPDPRPIPLPLSIGMDSSKLRRALLISMTDFDTALREIFDR